MKNRYRGLPAGRAPTVTMSATLGLCGLMMAGCAGTGDLFQNKAALVKAQKLQTDFAAYQSEQPTLYTALSANVMAFEAEEDALLDRFAANAERALTTGTPVLGWGALTVRSTNTREKLATFRTKIAEDMAAGSGKPPPKDAVKEIDTRIKTLKKEIAAGTAEAVAWDAMIASFREAIIELPDTLDGFDGEAALDRAIDLAKTQVQSGETKVDATAFFTEVLPVSEELAAVLKKELVNAPGIAVRILQLGLELAELEKARVEHDLAIRKLRHDVYQDYLLTDRVALMLLDEADPKIANSYGNSVSDLMISASRQEAPSGETFSRAVLGRHNTVFQHLYPVGQVVAASALADIQIARAELRLARIDHLASIRASEIGDQAWQALISSGIDGLVAYHESGVTEEDVANLIRLAQAVALFIIAE